MDGRSRSFLGRLSLVHNGNRAFQRIASVVAQCQRENPSSHFSAASISGVSQRKQNKTNASLEHTTITLQSHGTPLSFFLPLLPSGRPSLLMGEDPVSGAQNRVLVTGFLAEPLCCAASATARRHGEPLPAGPRFIWQNPLESIIPVGC